MKLLRQFVFMVGMTVLSCHHHLHVPPPEFGPESGPPAQPVSTIVLILQGDLSFLPRLIESQHCPVDDARGAYDSSSNDTIDFKYWYLRSPFNVVLNDNALSVKSSFRYEVHARLKAIPGLTASCGKGEKKPNFALSLVDSQLGSRLAAFSKDHVLC
ncbi:MAG: hypothetical protein U1A78_00305 [Polyangia bacterium]